MLNLLSRNHAETLRSSVFALMNKFTNDTSERKKGGIICIHYKFNHFGGIDQIINK